LLSELREGNMMADLERLTRSASEAASDLQKLQTEVRGCLFWMVYVVHEVVWREACHQLLIYQASFIKAWDYFIIREICSAFH
jgi:hypothetical protein